MEKERKPISYKNLQIEGGYADVILYDVSIKQQINQHAHCVLTALIPDAVKDKYLNGFGCENIRIVAKGVDRPLFCGIVTHADVKFDGSYYLDLQALSYTYLMDIEKKNRSFQNINESYQARIQQIVAENQGDVINEDESRRESFQSFKLQYLETDYELIRRLSSMHNIGAIADVSKEKPALWVGLPSGREAHKLESIDYRSIRKNSITSKNLRNEYIDGRAEYFLQYEILKCMIPYEMGDRALFLNQEMRIGAVESILDRKDGVLYHNYILAKDAGWKQPKLYNEKIQGLSLEGSVIDRKHAFSKLHLHIDETQNTGTASWFRFPAYYTAGDFKGWAGMPELGDTLSLHIPHFEENQAYILDSTRENYSITHPMVSGISEDGKQPSLVVGSLKNDRIMPQSKYIRQPDDHELVLSEEHILFRGTEGKITLRMDEKGIHAQALDGSIELKAENIRLGITPNSMGQPSERLALLGASDHIKMTSGLSSIYMDKKTSETIFSACNLNVYEGEMLVDENTFDSKGTGIISGANTAEDEEVEENIDSSKSKEAAKNNEFLSQNKEEIVPFQKPKIAQSLPVNRDLRVINPLNRTRQTEREIPKEENPSKPFPLLSPDVPQVTFLSLQEWQRIYTDLRCDEEILLVEPALNRANSMRGFNFAMADVFQFPFNIKNQFLGDSEEFVKHMKDLHWLTGAESIAVCINNTGKTRNEHIAKEYILDTFNEKLLPYWFENGKAFNVYWVE